MLTVLYRLYQLGAIILELWQLKRRYLRVELRESPRMARATCTANIIIKHREKIIHAY